MERCNTTKKKKKQNSCFAALLLYKFMGKKIQYIMADLHEVLH